MEQKKDKSIGAIWQKQSAYGTYLSISIEIDGVKHSYTAFANQYKEKDSQPDYRIMPPKRPVDGMQVTTKYEDQANIHKAVKMAPDLNPLEDNKSFTEKFGDVPF